MTCEPLDAILRAEFDWFQTRFRALSAAVDARNWNHSIRRMRFPVSVVYRVNDVACIPFLRLLPSKYKTPHFSYPTRLFP